MPNASTRKHVVVLTEAESAELSAMARSRSLPAALALRARIMLACEGAETAGTEVAKALGIDRSTVSKWRGRYVRDRVSGLYDELRPGRLRTVEDERVAQLINKALHTRPADGATHWSTRGLAGETGISKTTVARYLKALQIKPHRVESFKLSTDPLFIEKLRDVVGLYLNPPENALVLCVDEKSQCQALEHAQPMLPMGLGYAEGVTHDYVRHGTTTLFAALNVMNGQVLAQCRRRHRHQEFLDFLRAIDRAVPPELDVHCIAHNYASHKHPKVRAWLAQRPRWHMHFVPTYSSWLNQVERFFAIIKDKAIRRGSFKSVKELTTKIDTFISNYNETCKPFAWTATADSILQKLARLCGRISGTGH